MGPQRLDRAELRDRLADDAPGWVVDELADAFEPALLSFQRQAAKAERKQKRRPVANGQRDRQGRPQEAEK